MDRAASPTRSRAWRAFVLLGLLAAGAYFLLPSKTAQGILYDTIGLSAAVAIVVGVRLHRPARRTAWYLLAAGQLMFVGGDITWDVYELALKVKSPFPGVADVLYLLGYPFFVVALLLFVRQRTGGRDRESLIDAAIVAVGLGILAWAFIMAPYARDHTMSQLERSVSMAYPLMDILMLGMVARLLSAPGERTASFRFLSLSLTCTLIADVVFAVLELADLYHSGNPVDAVFMLSYVFLGAAALHPAMSKLTDRAPERETKLTRLRLSLLAVAAIIGPVIRTAPVAPTASRNIPPGSSIILFLLVVARMTGLVREIEAKVRQLRSRDAELESTLADLRRVQSERERLLDKTLQTAEQERTRLAAELHDGPIQRLAALSYALATAKMRFERGDRGTEHLAEAQKSLAEEIRGLRRLMTELRPPVLDERGLTEALRDQAEGFERRTRVTCDVDIVLEGRLPTDLETVLYRVAQEALANVAKHAAASHVWLSLRTVDGIVRMEVRDDGVGFDPATVSDLAQSGHFGLVAMRERVEMAGGAWRVRASRGDGTIVRVAIPVEPPASDDGLALDSGSRTPVGAALTAPPGTW